MVRPGRERTCAYWASEAKIAIAPFYFAGGATIYGLAVFHELAYRERGSVGLSRLASLLSQKNLKVHIEREEPWTAVGQVARDLMERRYTGKAVLHVRSESKLGHARAVQGDPAPDLHCSSGGFTCRN